MPQLTPVDHDPFAAAPAAPKLTPVDHDPFAAQAGAAATTLTPVDHDPFAAQPEPAWKQTLAAASAGARKPVPSETFGDRLGRVYGSQMQSDIGERYADAQQSFKTSQENAAYDPNVGGVEGLVRTGKSIAGLAQAGWEAGTAVPKGVIDATLGRASESATGGALPKRFASDSAETIGLTMAGGKKPTTAVAESGAGAGVGAIGKATQATFAPATMSQQAMDVAHYIRKAGGRGQIAVEQTASKLLKFNKRVLRGTPEQNRSLIGFLEGRSDFPVAEGEKGAFVPRGDKSFTLSPSEWKAARAAGMTGDDIEIANTIRDSYQRYRDQATSLIARNQGAAPQFIKDYYSHMWKQPAEEVERAMSGFFKQGSGRNFRKREIPTIEDGIARGLTPKSDNPIETTIAYAQNMSNFLATHDVQGWMKQEGHAKWFSPGQQPEGWVPLSGILTERVPRRVRAKGDFEGPNTAEPQKALPAPGQKKLAGAGMQGAIGVELKEMPEQAQLTGPGAGQEVVPGRERPAQAGIGARDTGPQLEDAAAKAKNITPGPAKAKPGKEPTPDRAPRKEVLYAPTDAARIYNNWISKGLETSTAVGEGFSAARKITNAMTATKLSMSAFHGMTMAQEAAISSVARGVQAASRGDLKTAGKALAKAPVAAVTAGLRGRRMGQELLDLKTASPMSAKVNQLYVDSGGRLRMDKLYRASESRSFYDAFKAGTFKEEVGLAASRVFGADKTLAERGKGVVAAGANVVQSIFQGPLFEDIIPAIKRGTFAERMEDFIKANPGAGDKELESFAVKLNDSMDNRFGELVQDNLFWNKQMKQTAQLLLLSPTWDLGTVREIGGGLVDVLGDSAKGVLQGKGVTDRTAYVVGLLATVATENAIMTYLKTGKAPQSPEDLAAYRTGGTDKRLGSAPERGLIPGYQKDVFAATDAMTPGSSGPLGELRSKLSPAAAAVVDTALNQNYAGKPIYGPGARSGAALDEVIDAAMPISVGQFSKRRAKGSNLSTAETALSIRQAPTYMTNPEALAQIRKRAAAKTRANSERSHLRQLEREEQ